MAEAYPAKLERALRARGWDVSVSNQGVRGGTARSAVYTIDRSIPPFTKLTIIQFGSNDRNLLFASAGDIAQSLDEIIRRVRAKGSAVILVRQWPPSDAAAFAAVSRVRIPSSLGIPTCITRENYGRNTIPATMHT